MKTVVLFDGVCNLCNSTVQFILRHDKAERFQFASQQSAAGQRLLGAHGLLGQDALAESVVVVEGDKVWLESDAAFHILYRLGGVWSIPAVLWFLPKGLRDWGYRLIAKNRYKLFGKRDSCMIPTPELRRRFLDAA
ncbi:MAG: thiol-disulfide oxidoreductase DCC family protein [Meiothermus sp.]|nr:thiol-disulfide oxidoreductase DCC family protein [Meiothermus sp.]